MTVITPDDIMIHKRVRRGQNMEWLPIVVIAVLVVILGMYYIVKWAVKDALKEYFKDKSKEE